MIRSVKLISSICEPLARSGRCRFSLASHGSTNGMAARPVPHDTYQELNNPRLQRNVDMGRQTFRVHAINELLNTCPDLSTNQLYDVVTGLTYRPDVKKNFSEIGRLKISGDERLDETVQKVGDSCLSISPEDVNSLAILSHPRFVLKHLCGVNSITTEIEEHVGIHCVTLSLADKNYTAYHTNVDEAIHHACIDALQDNFGEEVKTIDMSSFKDIPLEQDMDIGDRERVRTVDLQKEADEDFGFTIRGGQQKVIKDEDFIQRTIITPLLISHVEVESPAEVAGLAVGDQLLSVNLHNMENKLHKQMENCLGELVSETNVRFTVARNPHEMYKLASEEKILQWDYERVKEEMERPGLREWHAAKSRTDPLDYFMEQYDEAGKQKKRTWNTNLKTKKRDQLWHNIRPQMKYRKR